MSLVWISNQEVKCHSWGVFDWYFGFELQVGNGEYWTDIPENNEKCVYFINNMFIYEPIMITTQKELVELSKCPQEINENFSMIFTANIMDFEFLLLSQ